MAPYFYGLMNLAQVISVWMTIGMSLHRYVGVCLPFDAINILRRKRVVKFIIAIIIFSIVFNATRFLEVSVVNDCFRNDIQAMIPVRLFRKDTVS